MTIQDFRSKIEKGEKASYGQLSQVGTAAKLQQAAGRLEWDPWPES